MSTEFDEEDQWYINHNLGRLLEIEKSSEIPRVYIHGNIEKILAEMVENYNVKTLGVIDYNMKKPKIKTKKLPKRDGIGLISLDLGKDVGGHWAAFYYSAKDNIFVIYDSMQQGPWYKSNLSIDFENIIKKTYKTDAVTIAGCACKRDKELRSKNSVKMATAVRNKKDGSRQPTGGFVPSVRLGRLIRTDKAPDKKLRKTLTSYRAQHHFCYVEGLMFLRDMLKGKMVTKTCPADDGRTALIEAKKFMQTIVPSNYITNDFKYIYNPNTGNANKVLN